MKTENIPADIKSKSLKEARDEIDAILIKLENQETNLDNSLGEYNRLIQLNKHMDNLFKERKYTVIVEGVLDALSINAVSSLGNKLTQPQIDLINGIGNTVIVCPDRDKAGTNLIDVALENNWMVSFPEWEDNIKDTADAVKEYGQVYTLKSIIQSAENNTAKIEVLKRLGKK